ncbi:mas-related G-protein coupled receptor member X1-like [Micropterus dolomieu]|uniref:mas-related G-protein coupled receptor member X1-like n=1 Tax=Micropterus dolomieu TaxID=147949 RepID=UPI001E8D3171|nr:mas-related G-protein coupled receptor member X1-like [Micropterus dolomieu]
MSIQDDRFGRRWTSQHVSNCLLTFTNVFLQVRSDHVAPIYVINLLITDLIQLCYMIVPVVSNVNRTIRIISSIYLSGLVASVYFMVCIALERYLVIVHPLWYRCRRTIKSSVVVCVLVWVLSLVYGVLYYFIAAYVVRYIIFAVLLLLPFPLFIFFLVGTLKALSASISVPSDEKRRIVGVLVLVLLIYTLLFLPRIILNLDVNSNVTLAHLSLIFVRFSPLADLFLYVFMRKGFIDKILASVCCCRMDSKEISSSSVDYGLCEKQLTTEYSPYFLMFGREARYLGGAKRVTEDKVSSLLCKEMSLQKIESVHAEVTANIKKSQDKVRKRKQERGHEDNFKVGDLVLQKNDGQEQR